MFAKGSKTLELNDILNRISESQLLQYYLGITKIPCVINSPLRIDHNPSMGISTKDGYKIHYVDFATKESGGTFDLLQRYFHLSFIELLDKIYEDLNQGLIEGIEEITISHTTKGKVIFSENYILKCKVREWRDYDIQYWETYGISLPWLKFGRVYPISHTILTDRSRNVTYHFNADKLAYVYVEFKDNVESLKIYQPFNEKYKWNNNHDASVWDLWQQLPKTGENIIITSSRKDALCIWENSGIPSVSLQAESFLPKNKVVNELKQRFKNVYVLYDNDFTNKNNPGKKLGNSMAKEFELTQIEIPDYWQSKDTSDLAKNHGRKIVRQVILSLINK